MLVQMLDDLERQEGHQNGQPGVLKLNNDDLILRTCEVWANRLIATGKQYCRVLVVTEDSGMLAKAKHEGKVLAIRMRELPTNQEGLKELMFDRGLLQSLPVARHQHSPHQMSREAAEEGECQPCSLSQPSTTKSRKS